MSRLIRACLLVSLAVSAGCLLPQPLEPGCVPIDTRPPVVTGGEGKGDLRECPLRDR